MDAKPLDVKRFLEILVGMQDEDIDFLKEYVKRCYEQGYNAGVQSGMSRERYKSHEMGG